MVEWSARGIKGFLIRTASGELVFRVYDENKNYKDYEIYHYDLEVQIIDNYSSFFESSNGEELGRLDYPSRLFKE